MQSRKRRLSSTDESDTADDRTVQLQPPPELVYPSYQDLLGAVHSWTASKRYELVVSDPDTLSTTV
jgi:hypothetical protein